MKTAMVTGISVQNGANFTEFLLEKCRQVNRARRVTPMKFSQLDELCGRANLTRTFILSAPNFVDVSYNRPATTAHTTNFGVFSPLETVQDCNTSKRFDQSSTLQAGKLAQSTPQSQMTSCHPRSPYETETSVAVYSAFLDA